jgi:hypothetical protein
MTFLFTVLEHHSPSQVVQCSEYKKDSDNYSDLAVAFIDDIERWCPLDKQRTKSKSGKQRPGLISEKLQFILASFGNCLT